MHEFSYFKHILLGLFDVSNISQDNISINIEVKIYRVKRLKQLKYYHKQIFEMSKKFNKILIKMTKLTHFKR